MFNIRRKLLPGAVCLCMAVMVCSCQNLPHGERPYDYPPAKWVSESGDLWFEVTEDTMAREGNWYPILDGGAVIDGKTYECKVEFDSYVRVIFWDKNVWVQYMRDLEWENEWHPIPHPPTLVSGTCRFSPKKVKVSVFEGSQYFQNEKIIFIRQPSDKEEMTEKNSGKGWWWIIGANDLQ